MNHLRENRNIYFYYLLSVLTNFWFISSNWIYFWTKYMTFGQLGIVDGLGFGFALLLEIPTGAFGDLLGKKKTILMSLIFSTIGVFMIAFASSFSLLFWGWMITQIGLALFSGTGDAFLYDSLVDLKKENAYPRIVTNARAVVVVTYALTTFIGSYLYLYWFRLPQILWGVGYLMGIFVALFVVEPKVDTIKFSVKSYFAHLSVGFRLLFQSHIINYAAFALLISGAYYMYSWGFIRPAMANDFGFFVKEQGVIFPVIAIITTLIARQLPYIREKISDLIGLRSLLLIISLGFIFASFPVGKYGLVIMFVIGLCGHLAEPWVSSIVNKEVESKYRATTLSTIALLSKIPYVLLAVVAGRSIQNGTFKTFNLAFGLFLFLAFAGGLWINFIYQRKKVVLKL